MALSVTGRLKGSVGFCMSVSVSPLYISLWVFLCDCVWVSLAPSTGWLPLAHPCHHHPRSHRVREVDQERSCGGCGAAGPRMEWPGWVGSTRGRAWSWAVTGGRERGIGEGLCSAVPSLLPLLPALRLLAKAYLHGIYISFASRSIKNLTSSRLPGAACPAW